MGCEKRRAPRRPVDIKIRYSVTDMELGLATSVEADGKIIDISEYGFGLVTDYPLRRGHVITIKGGGKNGIPSYGMVKWTATVNGSFRAGLGYSYHD